MSMSNQPIQPPEWVRRRDGRQVPFDADRICQSLFAATEAMGAPNAFLARELTDAVVHFLAQDFFEPIPTTRQIAEHVETIVREVGHPPLARRYRQVHEATHDPAQDKAHATNPTIPISPADAPEDVISRCLETYSLHFIFSSDLRSAREEGLLHLSGLTAPETLASFMVDARSLGEESWWYAWEPWQACGSHWIVDSPEWLSILLADRLPIVRLCERIVSLPRLANHPVELHLNVAEPPAWIHSRGIGPLFAGDDNPFSLSHRTGFLDMLMEQCLATEAEHAPALAWHVNDTCFSEPLHQARMKMLARHAAAGEAVRFIFDRAGSGIALSEGMDRQCPGTLLEVGLDLTAFARRPEIALDGATLLKKIPSLARMAISAAEQKRRYLRNLPEDSPLRRGFMIERAVCSVVPFGLDAAVRSITGEQMTRSPLSLNFGLQILQCLNETLQDASAATNLVLHLDSPLTHSSFRTLGEPAFHNGLSVAQENGPFEKQLTTTGRLHAGARAGTAILPLRADADVKPDSLIQLLQWTWQNTSVVRLELNPVGDALQQGELAI